MKTTIRNDENYAIEDIADMAYTTLGAEHPITIKLYNILEKESSRTTKIALRAYRLFVRACRKEQK